MTTTKKLLALLVLGVALVLFSGAALYGAYSHGRSVKDSEWQILWQERNTKDAAAVLANESAARVKEQARQNTINQVTQDGQKIIDQAVDDAANARAAADSVQLAADDLARRLAAIQRSSHSCTSATSQAASRAVMVLADVFKRADKRAGELAADADQSRGRGMTCEQSFDGLGK